ncbi:MAG: acetyltransferase [Crocinitomicaceae bacterium]|jgi:sugar O-acyltransferase (sialic acid O-acetyltransferase NeuD family)|nr:acetyltransferase [Crocinitomicaceae bacterium]
MIIIGAGGFAIELLEALNQQNKTANLAFYDGTEKPLHEKLYGEFPVLRSDQEVIAHFKQHGKNFSLGIGNPITREALSNKFTKLGGILATVISPFAKVGSFGTKIGIGSCIMTGTIITNNITIGKGCLINLNCTIGHDSNVGDYCELSPGTHVSGKVSIGEQTVIGTGAVILPGITIGKNCVIGAGSVVTKNIPDSSVAVGVPAKIIARN